MTDLRVETLREHAAYRVTGLCRACERTVRINLMALAQEVGWDAKLADVRHRLTCRQCGGRLLEIQIGHDGNLRR